VNWLRESALSLKYGLKNGQSCIAGHAGHGLAETLPGPLSGWSPGFK
jgi:hypothetical protein